MPYSRIPQSLGIRTSVHNNSTPTPSAVGSVNAGPLLSVPGSQTLLAWVPRRFSMTNPPLWQRLLAALAYLLPFADAVPFGRTLFLQFPDLQILALPAVPLLTLERAVPFGGLVLFLLLFLLVVRNPQVPYLIRFHVLQAILIDIVLVLLSLAFSTLLGSFSGSFAVRTLENTIFLGTLALVLYAAVQALRGEETEIPTVSEAVRMQL